jgi:hypothetical protein
MRYRLQVRSDGRDHYIDWRDGIRPSTADADRLRGMFERLIQLVREHPEVRQVPFPNIACG